MAKKKTTEINKDAVVSFYIDHVLLKGHQPHSVYEFAKINGIEESEFYKYFASFEALEEQFFSDMFHYTLELLNKTADYDNYDAAQKMVVENFLLKII
jgi:hypothetical protein